jgi:endogenous inhibitor of DNA gyrase (YacG/DUF329 family)
VSAGPGARSAGRWVACPGCGTPALFAPANPFRPFCSERCRLVDLGEWAAEAYRVPVRPEPGAPDSPEGESEA